MRKISLISAAVLAAFSMSTMAASINTDDTGRYVISESGAYLDEVKIGNISSNYTNNYLSHQADRATIDTVTMSGTAPRGSYIKIEERGQTLQINNLILADGPESSLVIGTLEFWGQDDTRAQAFSIGSATIGENAVLRIQEGVNGRNPSSSVQIGSVTFNNKSVIAIGLAENDQEKFGADSISIDHITALDGAFSGIVQGALQVEPVQVGTIDIGNVEFDLGAKNKDNFGNYSMSPITLVGQEKNGGNVTVKMNGAQSKLVLGNVGQTDSSTTLNVNFSQEAFNSEVSNVTFGEDASVVGVTNLSLTAENAAKGSSTENVEALNKLLGKVNTTDEQEFASTSLTATSDVFDTVTAQTKDGKVDTSTMRTHENAEVFSFAQLHSVGVMQWREEMNHMQLRLGEIRDAAGYNNGAWARIYNGKDEYGSQDVENKYYGVQVGYDHRLEGTNWIIGGAFSYARGDSTFSTGEGDNHNFTFTGYGTWLADNGFFVDVTGKIGRLSNDITIDHYTSDYDTNAVSVTAEAGWRFALNDIFYVEPQAEMMYGHIMSADYRTQTYKADTEAVDMWVGRLGFQTGLTCPEKKGGVYFRASVLHDFDGDAETKFTGLKSGDTRKVLDELGGTWYEMGIGANYNVTDNTYLYADFQYANGGEIDTPWRWNLGVRVNF
ncbi:autotransporter outer membrane beta-barrel domain-containing protein [Parasutterella secunda]|uniref:autotransporter outer membrane beta-barrel domain-containing protein n=1 Tax=Parasutterella secunda TaxID=626947 RepID=UPI0025A3BB6C|nr:autotransporter outer membrane beta-barrel domain-containing protein [Parasutterella secunda]MDM8112789.1 autotransporter outer membrane beta-barrel domain-containing protein [Parasutterella secunda]